MTFQEPKHSMTLIQNGPAISKAVCTICLSLLTNAFTHLKLNLDNTNKKTYTSRLKGYLSVKIEPFEAERDKRRERRKIQKRRFQVLEKNGRKNI